LFQSEGAAASQRGGAWALCPAHQTAIHQSFWMHPHK
jgi:hypothetical protein